MRHPGIGYSRTQRQGGFDWDTFWQFTSRHKVFNRLLYAIHFHHYQRLLEGILPNQPRILELGAGSGEIARRLVRRWGGRATLVDSNWLASQLFLARRAPDEPLDYILGNIFELHFPPVFDLVYSDGLIEHFPEKSTILAAHTRALKVSGHVLLFVPNNSLFFRTLSRFGPDMGYEERYTMKALAELCQAHSLRVLRQTEYFFAVGVLCEKESPR
jgi:SAM-dependent methyltransferase